MLSDVEKRKGAAMATRSNLYHTMRLRGYRHPRTEYVGGVVRHHVKLRRKCP